MKFTAHFFWIIFALFALLSAILVIFLTKKNEQKNYVSPQELKEAKQQFQVSILRYEDDLFSLDLNCLPQEVERLSKKYPPLLIEPDSWNDPNLLEGLKAYLQDTIIVALYETAKTIKTDILLKKLETAFGYYKVFYPNDSIPTIITLIPGLDDAIPSVYLYDDILFVHIDMYLGADNPYYQSLFPLYIAERCDPVYLPVDIFKKAMVYKKLERTPRSTLLEAMITEGKKLFFTEMMFPDLHERYIIGYSEPKYKWANEYSGNVWNHFIEKNELFGKGEALMRSYIEEAPFTKIFGNESPGRIGSFIGWKLIQSYMKNNPEITLNMLIQETDYEKILNQSRYKPVPR